MVDGRVIDVGRNSTFEVMFLSARVPQRLKPAVVDRNFCEAQNTPRIRIMERGDEKEMKENTCTAQPADAGGTGRALAFALRAYVPSLHYWGARTRPDQKRGRTARAPQ